MKKIASLLSVVVLVALLVFVVQNLNATEIAFLTWEWEMSLAVPILGAYVLGGFTARRLWRLINGTRKQRKIERKAQKKAEASARSDEAKAAENQIRR